MVWKKFFVVILLKCRKVEILVKYIIIDVVKCLLKLILSINKNIENNIMNTFIIKNFKDNILQSSMKKRAAQTSKCL